MDGQQRVHHGPRRRAASAGPGPIVLLLPLMVLALALLHIQERRPGLGRRAQPPAAADGGPVGAWVGSADAPSGGRLQVSLTRLHSDPDRQRFETTSLGRRLQLGKGEPWRLALRHVGDEGADLDLARMVVEDAAGGRLRPLPAPVTGEGVADPLAVLLAAPAHLAAGSARTLVLWGPAPGDAPRLCGLPGSVAPIVSLAPSSVARSELDGTLASIERFARAQPAPAGE